MEDKKIGEIIYQLDQYARNYDSYEYGLPSYPEHMNAMSSIIRNILFPIIKGSILYIWRAYYSSDHFNQQEFFSQEVFSDFDKMKKYSAQHAETFKEIHSQYCSTYWKIELP